jgi:hypothetical protein
MNELSVDAQAQARQFYVMTGAHGERMINDAMQRQVRVDSALRKLVTARSMKRLTREEANTLRDMIRSPDEENLTVAECILKEKVKHKNQDESISNSIPGIDIRTTLSF